MRVRGYPFDPAVWDVSCFLLGVVTSTHEREHRWGATAHYNLKWRRHVSIRVASLHLYLRVTGACFVSDSP